MIFFEIWECKTYIKTTISLPPFELVYGIEVILPIENEIPLSELVIRLLTDTTELE